MRLVSCTLTFLKERSFDLKLDCGKLFLNLFFRCIKDVFAWFNLLVINFTIVAVISINDIFSKK